MSPRLIVPTKSNNHTRPNKKWIAHRWNKGTVDHGLCTLLLHPSTTLASVGYLPFASSCCTCATVVIPMNWRPLGSIVSFCQTVQPTNPWTKVTRVNVLFGPILLPKLAIREPLHVQLFLFIASIHFGPSDQDVGGLPCTKHSKQNPFFGFKCRPDFTTSIKLI